MIISYELWARETSRVQEKNPLLTWEACEMIAWNRLNKMYGDIEYEDLDRKVPEKG